MSRQTLLNVPDDFVMVTETRAAPRAIAGDGPFHLPEPLIEDRLRRAQAALRKKVLQRRKFPRRRGSLHRATAS